MAMAPERVRRWAAIEIVVETDADGNPVAPTTEQALGMTKHLTSCMDEQCKGC